MCHNTSLTECDLRLTQVDEDIVSSITQVVWANQSSEPRQDQEKSGARREVDEIRDEAQEFTGRTLDCLEGVRIFLCQYAVNKRLIYDTRW